MKANLWILASLLSLNLDLFGAINVTDANGTDGVLNITADTVIDLALAPTGTAAQNNTPNAGKGVYDPTKWAVVFKYTSVNVAAGATLTFKNHASRAPVVWLVNGNVTIAGTVSLNGQDYVASPLLAEPGPGGFRGGVANYGSSVGGGAGFGPGGGLQTNNNAGSNGSFGTVGFNNAGNGVPYGNPSLIPLIGGSGGAADPEVNTSTPTAGLSFAGGAAGGGAMLIASTGTVSINGEVKSNGGAGIDYGNRQTGGGSGGGIRIVCSDLTGTGKVTASGGGGWSAGGLGRVRLERVNNTNSLQLVPDPSVVPLAANDTATVWPPANAPTVRIVSVGGTAAPSDPRAGFGSAGADVALPEASTTQIVIETVNVESASQVQVRVTPRAGANATLVNAAVSGGTAPTLTWTATLPVNSGYSALQVKVVRP